MLPDQGDLFGMAAPRRVPVKPTQVTPPVVLRKSGGCDQVMILGVSLTMAQFEYDLGTIYQAVIEPMLHLKTWTDTTRAYAEQAMRFDHLRSKGERIMWAINQVRATPALTHGLTKT